MTMETVLTELTDEFIQSTIRRAVMCGRHTDGGDAFLPGEERDVLTNWDVVKCTGAITVSDIYPALVVTDVDDPQETVLGALAVVAEDRWRGWVLESHPDWDHRGYEDVIFQAEIGH